MVPHLSQQPQRRYRSAMARYLVNDDAVAHVRALVDARQYVLDSDWGAVQPGAAAQNAYLERHTWDEYARWHLGLTDGAGDHTKARYAFAVGDFRRVHRSALIACVYRASRVASQGGRAGRARPAPAPRRDERLRTAMALPTYPSGRHRLPAGARPRPRRDRSPAPAGHAAVALPPPRRLDGLDLARGVAVLSMLVAHLSPVGGPADVTEYLCAPLFAVVIGVSMGLRTSREPREPGRHRRPRQPPAGGAARRARAGAPAPVRPDRRHPPLPRSARRRARPARAGAAPHPGAHPRARRRPRRAQPRAHGPRPRPRGRPRGRPRHGGPDPARVGRQRAVVPAHLAAADGAGRPGPGRRAAPGRTRPARVGRGPRALRRQRGQLPPRGLLPGRGARLLRHHGRDRRVHLPRGGVRGRSPSSSSTSAGGGGSAPSWSRCSRPAAWP